jgi:hypothetical protein
VSRATLAFVLALVACNDLRNFAGFWHGPSVGGSPAVRMGIASDAFATLEVLRADRDGLQANVSIDGLASDTPIASIPGAEADVLSNVSFAGSPLRVYFVFLPTTDGKGDAIGLVALYEDRRIELRVLRGGTAPIYAIFALVEVS